VNLVDANVLLYAVNRDSEHHRVARRWLDTALSGASPVAFAWVPVLAFLRLSTRVGLFPRPLTAAEATTQVDRWLTAGPSVLIDPTSRHHTLLAELLRGVGTGGNLTSDAHLAALSIEHRATIVSYDADFTRFPGVTWQTPG
jgi:toxin-antitoxin system PIN domain toxin